mgnify:CR=1 FL=1
MTNTTKRISTGQRGPQGGHPGAGNQRVKENPKNVRKTIQRILSYISDYRWQFVIVIICLILSSLSSVVGIYFLKPLVNDYIVPFIGHENPDLSGFISMLAVMAGIYLSGVVASYISARLMLNISTGTLRRIRVEMFTHMQTLPIKYFDTHSHGEIMSRYTNDVDTLREMISMSLPQFITSMMTVVGVFVMMTVLSWRLLLIVVLQILVMLVLIRQIGGRGAGFFIKQQRNLGAVNGYIEEMIEGQKVIKVFSHEPKVKSAFAELNYELFSAASNASTFANVMMPIMGNLSYMFYALTAAVGGILAINGLIDIGSIGSFLQYTRNLTMPIVQLSQQFNTILSALAGAERIFNLIDEPSEIDEGTVTLVNATISTDGEIAESVERTGLWAWKDPQKSGAEAYHQLKGDVRFEHVNFGYDPEKLVLNNVSLYAKPGQKIAFVGSTGAGKTTITNLINRFYDIQSGRITFDGINIRDIRKDDLRRSISMVLQDTHLFTGTVSENIRYGKLDADQEAILRAAKLANADFFIRHLPQGYDTVLTADGANLSQGQRQLLAIARAAVKDPPVLILDEATSSIDTRTEALIEKGMNKLMEGRTVFVIAHRLSTVRNAKAIIVLENGEIIERGDHNYLLQEQGRYYQLYTGLFELV